MPPLEWHGYILLEKPDAMPMNAWANALEGLVFRKKVVVPDDPDPDDDIPAPEPPKPKPARLDGSPDDPQPARRLHTRTSLDGTKVIVESVFPEGRINAIENNQAKVTRWAFGGEWMGSRAEVRAYLRANQAEWEEEV